ncbi:MAG: 4Fe-4S binding protein [candidate division NC10 bacterium]|nr:4Fe-4S binding protein [candidate division NC10 bacterium]
MRIDPEKCIGCGNCSSYCTMLGGIMRFERDRKNPTRIYYVIDEDECVECSVCLRSGCCPTEALYQPELVWPRIVRKNFSDPLKIHPETRIPGRGTEEMKTNEVTGRYRRGMYGMACELGRPGVGARFRDVEKVAGALAALGIGFEENNPVTKLMMDRKKGLINPEVRNEKVLSAIVEFMIPAERLPEVLEVLDRVSQEIGTVFSGDIIARIGEDGSVPYLKEIQGRGRFLSINGKSNVGLGRPLAAV